MTVKLDSSLGFYENALRLTSKRQEVLASNIANSDTPNYKARDFDFKTAMMNAMNASSMPTAVEMTQINPLHLDAGSFSAGKYTVLRKSKQNSQDGNTVDIDVERAAFTENALRYESAISFENSEIKNLTMVLQG
ncbi:MAG: flagellar basal body rod protein FlgB [Methylococcaceae bacterium]|jgi:flagellar basal-body rod protein FlgB